MKIKRLTCFILCLLISSGLQADFEHFDFAEPGTGKKVHNYSVELKFSNQQPRSYRIPQDCQKITNEVKFGSTPPNEAVQKALWFKIINDCRYVTFLHQKEDVNAVRDLVSDYDFYNARLADLPFESRCQEMPKDIETCKSKPASPGKLKLTAFFPFLEIYLHDGKLPVETCRFYNGAFRGELYLTEEGVKCHRNFRGRGLRLLSIDYADLNADGFMDVLLRMIPLGSGVSRMPIYLPLTRLSEEAGFSIPEGISLD